MRLLLAIGGLWERTSLRRDRNARSVYDRVSMSIILLFAPRDGPKVLSKESRKRRVWDLSVGGAYIYISLYRSGGEFLRKPPSRSCSSGCDGRYVFFSNVLAMSYECHLVTARRMGDCDPDGCIAAIHLLAEERIQSRV